MTKLTTGFRTYLNDGTVNDTIGHFKLSAGFLKSYAGTKPKFGFNGLGEFVFYRTYSRVKKDGSKETFLDMAIRVIEGCYEIQRLHCKKFHIPFDLSKAQKSAQEMFQRMWDFKFLPPGRGLWMMGTDFMWEKGSASLNNCFDGKTEIITKDGIKPIGQLVGTEQELLTTDGKWVKAPIKSFGQQELYKLVLGRSGVEKVIYTTANHRWFAVDRRKIGAACGGGGMVAKTEMRQDYKEVITTDLAPKHSLQSVFDSDSSYGLRDRDWRVKSVEATGEIAEVYCAQVPETQAFALADNILTGNCAFVSTDDKIEADPAEPFCFLMDMSLLGVGVGFDTKGAGKVKINRPDELIKPYVISDSREGWVDSVRELIHSFTTTKNEGFLEFDYSLIRPAGAPIKGFGGTAAGPGILQELHELIKNHLTRRIGSTLSSVDITDIMNYIGRCVVAGNVRRCLPKGTLVHLKRGLVPIEQVQVGDLVLTADGYYPVAENVTQGIQRVITINSQTGPFRCTDRHRIAVMTGVGVYEWKRAHQLKAGDRMVFVDAILPGTPTVMPGYSDLSTRGNNLVVPGLIAEVAWFLGAIQGDGYVYLGRQYKARKNHGASVSIPINRDEYHDLITEKAIAGFAAFGFTPKEQSTQDNSRKIRVTSRRFAKYLHTNLKQAETPLNVPEYIRLGLPEIRAAYLAGLLDTDGSTKNRPATMISSIYRDFLRQVQAVYSSLGIPTKLRLRKEADDKGQAKWDISLVGDFAIARYRKLIQPHAVKMLRETTNSSGHDYGYPAEWINRDNVDCDRSWSPQQDQMTYNRVFLCDAKTACLVPIEVESVVDEGIMAETFDLSVPDRSEFVAEGRLVHNTAEIAFGNADDFAYSSMKNPIATLNADEVAKFYECTQKIYSSMRSEANLEDFNGSGIPEERLIPAIETWNALNHHRWASNNSVFANVGMNYNKIGEQIAANGEPGLIWLDNIRDYGRMIDGRQPGIDGRVMGTNPCFSGSMRLLTADGYKTMEELWRLGGEHVYNGLDNIDSYGKLKIVNRLGLADATNVYKTSESSPLYKVIFDDGQEIEATHNHRFVIINNGTENIVPLSDVIVGDKVPLSGIGHFGNHEDREVALLAGWVVGDGSLSQQKSGQTTAHMTCYQEDTIDVMPVLKASMYNVYDVNSTSAGVAPAYEPWERKHKYFTHKQNSIRSNVLGRLLKAAGIEPGSKHNIPNFVWSSNAETISAFLKGLFSADGTVNINNRNLSASIRLTQSSKQLLSDCQLLLTQFGIRSKVVKRQNERMVSMNDGKGGRKDYLTRTTYELIISRSPNMRLFMDNIGFIQAKKNDKINNWLNKHPGSNNSAVIISRAVVSIEKIKDAATYCLTEPKSTLLFVQGQVIGNCCEQSLESYELCCLCETFPANHDDVEDYMRTLKFAYLYAKTVTLLPTHNARTNHVMLRNRRIGLSQSGIVQAFAKFGRRKMLTEFCDAGFQEIKRWDSIYADWLCIQKSIKVTSVKPSGSVSLLAGATPGIHYPEAGTYWRTVRVAKDSILVKILSDAGYRIEPSITDKDRTVVVYFGVTDERVQAVDEVGIWQQMANATDYQRYWADNQVSCTIKFKQNEAKEIGKVLEVYEDQTKGISFLPYTGHNYPQAPYIPCTKEEVDEYNNGIRDADYSEFINEALGSKFCDGDSCELS